MAPPPRRNRFLLWLWAVFSLVITVQSTLFLLASAPVTAEAASAMAHGGDATLKAGDRMTLEPVSNASEVVTLSMGANESNEFGAPGEVLYWTGDATVSIAHDLVPLGVPSGNVSRALAYVERNASGGWDARFLHLQNVSTLSLSHVPRRNPATDKFEVANVTVNLTSLVGDKGFIVKRDAAAEPEARLVPVDRVIGKIGRTTPSLLLWISLSLSALGTIVPLVLIITTHRGRGVYGVPGPGGATGPACPECGRPAVDGTTFCVKCGADLTPRKAG